MPEIMDLDARALQTILTLIVITMLLALGSRRLIIVPLALQYVLVAAQLGPVIGLPLFGIRLTLGLAISAILYITGGRMEGLLRGHRTREGWVLPGGVQVPQMGPAFRLLTLVLAALIAFGLWTTNPVPELPEPVALTAFWLVCLGVGLVMTGGDPLLIGIGVMISVSGFQTAYLTLESSLLVVAFTGVLDLLITLAIAYTSDRWLEATMREASET